MANSRVTAALLAACIIFGATTGLAQSLPSTPAAPATVERMDLLDMASGAVVLSKSSEYAGTQWSALALIDGNPSVGWCSAENAPFPHEILIELARPSQLESIAFDQTNDQSGQSQYSGVSTKDAEVWASNTSPTEGFSKILQVQVPKGGRQEFKLPAPTTARWLKFIIRSNYGQPNYTELMELEAYGQPIAGAVEQAPLTGTYTTNSGPLTLIQSGTNVRGCYYEGGGTLNGSTDGRVVQFEWRQNAGKRVGTAMMVLSAKGDFLNGFWYEGGNLAGSWFGTRGGEDQCKKAVATSTTAQETSAIATGISQTGKAIVYGIHFDTASDKIKPESDATLNEVLALMKSQPALVLEIGGHTDAVGNDAYNQDLSQRRAQSVVAWLTSKGIPADHLLAKGYGKTVPVADNATPQGRALNRRVELTKK